VSGGPKHNRDFEGILRDAGLRVTGPRKTILRSIADQGDHPDALEIYRRAKQADAGVSLATVYRTMKVLQDKGAIRRLSFEGGPSRFEPADSEHHDHIVDVETGQVIEFRSEEIERLQEEVASKLGYEIISHRLEIYARRRPK
jgi:Fur family ferric uptake transcriptional regulator